jgi:hypothetical protein
MDGRTTHSEGLMRWALARNATVDALEAMGFPTDDGWPPYWSAPIPHTTVERHALEVLAALRLEGGPDDPEGRTRR